MKIEILDRQYYLKLVDDKIKSIKDARKEEDDLYEKAWRKTWFKWLEISVRKY